MTNRLYDTDPYLMSTPATIIGTTNEYSDMIAIELDQTILYPEGGGQPSDHGILSIVNSDGTPEDIICKILSVETKDTRIWHLLDPSPLKKEELESTLTIGKNVRISLDWERRFHHMQQHLGQHLLSAAFFKAFDAKTIGFHMGADYVTIDLDKKLSIDEVRHAETIANHQITGNLAVNAHYPDDEALGNMSLRKVPKVTEDIRIVSVDGFDHTPCGGTHPHHTGEVGIISVRKSANYKNGIRVEFICGHAALKELQTRTDMVNDICASLSTQESSLPGRIDALSIEIESLKRAIRELSDKNMSFEAKHILSSPNITTAFMSSIGASDLPEWLISRLVASSFNDMDQNALKALSAKISELSDTSIRLLTRTFEGGFTIILDLPSDLPALSAKQVLKTLQDAYEGKGGGSDKSAQMTFNDGTSMEIIIRHLIQQLSEAY